MKIAVITFFDNGNYGSELQAFAMSDVLKQLGHEPLFYKIKASNLFGRALEIGLDKLSIYKNCIINKEFRQIQRARTNNLKHQRVISPTMRACVHSFTKESIEINTVPRHRFGKMPGIDCYLCGSDQVWSALRLPIRKENFLVDISSNRKVAYAPSFGLDNWPEYFKKRIADYLKDFKYISVREESAKEQLRLLINREVDVVLDPTMLVGRSFWENQLGDGSIIREVGEKYVFCYFLGNMPQSVLSTINQQYPNHRIVCLPYAEDATVFENGTYFDANPKEFVSLIKHSDMVQLPG